MSTPTQVAAEERLARSTRRAAAAAALLRSEQDQLDLQMADRAAKYANQLAGVAAAGIAETLGAQAQLQDLNARLQYHDRLTRDGEQGVLVQILRHVVVVPRRILDHLAVRAALGYVQCKQLVQRITHRSSPSSVVGTPSVGERAASGDELRVHTSGAATPNGGAA